MSLVDELGSLEPNDSFLLYFNHIFSRKGEEMFAYLLIFGHPLRKNKGSSGKVMQNTKKIASLWKKIVGVLTLRQHLYCTCHVLSV